MRLSKKDIRDLAETAHTSPNNTLYLPGEIRLTRGPAVFLTGEDVYTVLFVTDTAGVGRVKVGGRTFTDSVCGIARTDRVHSVPVPRKVLDGAGEYTVYARRIYHKGDYFCMAGCRTERSFPFVPAPEKGDLDLLVVTDAHSKLDSAAAAAAKLPGRHDALILLGDECGHGRTAESLTDCIIGLAHTLTGGGMPCLYCRGNHETRGEYATVLPGYFRTGTGGMHYAATLAGRRFVVFDTGEDKEDSHREYSGFADFDGYREKQFEDLSRLVPDGRPVVAVAHIPDIDDRIGRGANAKLKELGCFLELSGHQHSVEVRTDGEFPVLVTGGPCRRRYKEGAVEGRVEETGSLKDPLMYCASVVLRENGEYVFTLASSAF